MYEENSQDWNEFLKSVSKIDCNKINKNILEFSFQSAENKKENKPQKFLKINSDKLFNKNLSVFENKNSNSKEISLNSHYSSAIKSGKLKPDYKIDLHGMNINQAHKYFCDNIKIANSRNYKFLLVVTGKSTFEKAENEGDFMQKTIKQEINSWIMQKDISDYIKFISPAQKKDGGNGAFYLFLK